MPVRIRRFAYTRQMFDMRNCRPADLPVIRELNNAAVPAVNDLTPAELEWFLGNAACFRVAERAGRVGAFLIGLNEGLDYQSENYRWFSQRFEGFAYVDRVVVADWAQRNGLASRFYEDFAECCATQSKRLVCEVNLEPPNEGSMRFHERLGFRQIGSQATDGGRKRVALLERRLD